MSKIIITGWTTYCDKIAATKQLREKTPMPLDEAHGLVNRVLRGERVAVQITCSADADALADSLNRVGLIAMSVNEVNADLAARE